MIKKIKNFICSLFGIKQCACSEKDEHLQLYEDPAEPETPVYIEENGKLKHCTGHLRFRKSCPRCQEIVQ